MFATLADTHVLPILQLFDPRGQLSYVPPSKKRKVPLPYTGSSMRYRCIFNNVYSLSSNDSVFVPCASKAAKSSIYYPLLYISLLQVSLLTRLTSLSPATRSMLLRNHTWRRGCAKSPRRSTAELNLRAEINSSRRLACALAQHWCARRTNPKLSPLTFAGREGGPPQAVSQGEGRALPSERAGYLCASVLCAPLPS